MIRPSDKRLITDFEELVDVVKGSTSIDPFEGAGDRRKRITGLLGNYTAFCSYYFPEYCFAPFAWFHKEHLPRIAENPDNIYLLQYAREFAKTTHSGLFLPLFLKFRGELTGMLVGSHDESMASEKLMDIQANLEGNQRIINDFGEQMSYGSWEAGRFKTKDDIGFYGFGKRQSPRGTKFKWKRPNYGLIDDLNDKRQLKNDDIAHEDMAWVMEEFKPALWIRKWWLVVAQNKFHDNTVTALIEADEEVKKVVLRADMKDENGNSNWPENFTNEMVQKLEETEGNAFTRERMNTPMEEGKVFKPEWMPWVKPLPFGQYDSVLVHYLDPSYKSTEKSDYKFWVLIAKRGKFYDILKAWGEKTTSKAMWEYAFDLEELIGEAATVKHAMEGNFIQEEMHKAELERVEEDKGRALRVLFDKRSKGDKYERIETLQPLFQRLLVRFSEEEKDSPGMKLLRKQMLAFERGSRINDDGPDALESAIWIADHFGRKESRAPKRGNYRQKTNRSM
jgi:hypothetical protein